MMMVMNVSLEDTHNYLLKIECY